MGEAKRQRSVKEGTQDLLELPLPLVLGMIGRFGPRSPQVEIRASYSRGATKASTVNVLSFSLNIFDMWDYKVEKIWIPAVSFNPFLLDCIHTETTGTSWPTSAASLQFLSSQRLEHIARQSRAVM